MKKRWINLLIFICLVLSVVLVIFTRQLLVSNGLKFFGALNEESASEVIKTIETGNATELENNGASVLEANGYRYSVEKLFLPRYYQVLFILLLCLLVLLFILIWIYFYRSDKAQKKLRETCNDTTDQLANLKETQESELQKISEYQGNVYHQLASSLSGIRIALDTLEKGKKTKNTIPQAQYNLSRTDCLLKLLMKEEKFIEKKQNFNYQPFSLTELLEEVISETETMLQFNNCTLKTDMEEEVIYTGDDVWLKECFLSIFINSMEHAGENSSLSLTCRKIANCVRIDFGNSGTPLSDEQAEHMFERYYSDKPGHMGIGMHMAYSVIQQHHGTLQVSNTNEGVCISILLPVLFGKDTYLSQN